MLGALERYERDQTAVGVSQLRRFVREILPVPSAALDLTASLDSEELCADPLGDALFELQLSAAAADGVSIFHTVATRPSPHGAELATLVSTRVAPFTTDEVGQVTPTTRRGRLGRRRRWLAAAAAAAALIGVSAYALLARPPGAAPPRTSRSATAESPALPPTPRTAPLAPTKREHTLPPRSASSPSRPAASPPTPSLARSKRRPRRTPQRSSAARGLLRISSEPAYAEVYVGRRRVGTTPCQVRLASGRQVVRLVNPHLGLRVQRVVYVEPGASTLLKVEGFR